MIQAVLHKTIRHFFPQFNNWLKTIPDPRLQELITYPLPNLMWVGVFLFLLKLGARRQIKYLLNNPVFLGHLNFLAETENDSVAHGDTLNNLLSRIPESYLMRLTSQMLHRLIRMRVLESYRLLNRYYLIAIDATGVFCFSQRHCPCCLTTTSKKTGKTIYYHHVLEAKLVTPTGLAFSLATEFIENPKEIDLGNEKAKQDCELKAFYRLAPKIKALFPQLNICLDLDALYACNPVFDICKKFNWKFLIVFKKGSMPDTFEEFMRLMQLQPENNKTVSINNHKQLFAWANDILYANHRLQAIQCLDVLPQGEPKKFVWISNLTVNYKNCDNIANNGGRQRWKIENQGFNIQKNGGYNLEHAFGKDRIAGKNYYLLLQIAHTINQLMEKGNLLKNINTTWGSLKNFTLKLLMELTTQPIDQQTVQMFFQKPFQIRLNSS